MTTETNPTPPSIASQIDAMVAASGRRHEAIVQADPGAVEVRTAPDTNGKLQSTVTVHRAPASGNDNHIHDAGIDIPSTAAKREATLKAAEDALAATAGFDPVTGKPAYVLPEGSGARKAAERELQQLRVSTAYDLQMLAKLQAQRTAEANRSSAADREATLTATFTKGSPERAALLKEELARLEAAQAAEAIMNARRGR